MLQRIQSIYLLAASLVMFALFLFPVAHDVYINGIPSTIKVTGIYQDAGGAMHLVTPFTVLTIVTVVVAIVPLIVIFLFKDRKKQITFSYGAIFVILAYTFWLSQTVKTATGGFEMKTSNFGIGVILSSLSILLLIMAAKAIGRDEKLVKSADRLR